MLVKCWISARHHHVDSQLAGPCGKPWTLCSYAGWTKWFRTLAWVGSLHGARADYNGGSPNSLNGANLVKSHKRAVYCVLPHRPPHAHAHVIVIACWIKSHFAASRLSIIHKKYPAHTVTKDLMWYRNTFTHFHFNMHLTFDPLKHLASHKSPSVRSPFTHPPVLCKCSCP